MRAAQPSAFATTVQRRHSVRGSSGTATGLAQVLTSKTPSNTKFCSERKNASPQYQLHRTRRSTSLLEKNDREDNARKVFDDPVRIRLDPEVEQQEREPSDPAQNVE